MGANERTPCDAAAKTLPRGSARAPVRCDEYNTANSDFANKLHYLFTTGKRFDNISVVPRTIGLEYHLAPDIPFALDAAIDDVVIAFRTCNVDLAISKGDNIRTDPET